jgi:integrase/recombinase XerD
MHDLVTVGPWLRRFLCEHIVTERNLARNTRKSYRDTFSLLLPFVSRKLRKPVGWRDYFDRVFWFVRRSRRR